MLTHYKSELICDLAEYYGIYDYRSVPGRLLGTLAVGLRADSRVGMAREGIKADPNTFMLVRIYDLLAQVFSKEEHKPLARAFLVEQEKDMAAVFKSPEDFKAAWNKR